MKILFLNEYAPPHQVSGAEYSMMALAEGLRSAGQTVLTLSPDLSTRTDLVDSPTRSVLDVKFPFWKKLHSGQVLSPLWFNNPIFWLYSTWHILKTVKTQKINIIHVHGKYILPGAVIAGRLLRKPVVITIRDFKFLCPLALCFTNQQKRCNFSYYINKEIPEYRERYNKTAKWKLVLSKLWQYKLKWLLKQADQLIAISPQLRQIYLDSGVNNIVSIYNLPPLKIKNLKPEYKLEGKKIIVSVGKLSYGKGTDTLFKAMNLISKKIPQATLLIAGNKNISLKVPFPSNTQYLGRLSQTEVQKLYLSADLFIILSRWPEPLGRATLEALTFGLPIIASNRGGGNEFVANNGFLVNPDDPTQVSEAIIKVLNHPNPNQLRQNSLKLLDSRFNRRQIIQDHLNLYKTLCSKT